MRVDHVLHHQIGPTHDGICVYGPLASQRVVRRENRFVMWDEHLDGSGRLVHVDVGSYVWTNQCGQKFWLWEEKKA